MSYIHDSLSKGEEVYQLFKHHWMVKWLIVIHFIVAIATFGIWLIPAILVWLSWKNTEQGVTNKRVISKYGIFSRKTSEIRLDAIESIFITQGVFGRVFDYGMVTITGRGQKKVNLKWMSNPLRVKREIESIEYGEKQSLNMENDNKPFDNYEQGIENSNKKFHWIIICFVAITVIVVLANNGENDKNKSPMQSEHATKLEVTQEPEKAEPEVNQVTDNLQDQSVTEEQGVSHPEPKVAEAYAQQPISTEESKGVEDKKTTWTGKWDNDIVAIVSAEQCSDRDFLNQGYNYFASTSIPESRLKKVSDAYFVSSGRATTVIGCWFKKEGGLIHAKLKRKHDGKTWELDLKLDDGTWTSQAEGAVNNHLQDSLDEANKRINIVWNGATKEMRAVLLPEQKEWLRQRENDCALKASTEEPNDAIKQDTIRLNCMAAMTDQRTDVLKQKISSLRL